MEEEKLLDTAVIDEMYAWGFCVEPYDMRF